MTADTEAAAKPSSRESARLKKRAQRERRLEEARIRAVAEAERIEAEAESLAPEILRKPILDGDHMLRGPLIEIVAGRAVHGAALPQFSSTQNRAAHRLLLDWREVSEGCGVPAVDYGRSGGGGSGLGGHQAMLGQIRTLARLDAALTFLGAFTPGIRRVVLERVPIPVWSTEVKKTPEDALAWVRAGLDRLGLFYFPPSETSTKRGFLTFGPSRASYDTTIPREGT